MCDLKEFNILNGEKDENSVSSFARQAKITEIKLANESSYIDCNKFGGYIILKLNRGKQCQYMYIYVLCVMVRVFMVWCLWFFWQFW